MAQPLTTRLEYLGTIEVKEGEQYTAASLASAFPGATTFILKSKGKIVNGVREDIEVGINNTPMAPIAFNETSSFDVTRTPPLTYKFSQDCIIMVAKDLDVTP